MNQDESGGADYRVGDRIMLHPATDRWMMGDRYGEVVRVGVRFLSVKMDRSGETIMVRPHDVATLIVPSLGADE